MDHPEQADLHHQTGGEVRYPTNDSEIMRIFLPNYKKTTFMSLFPQLYALRKLMQGSEQTPKAPLGNNARPLQALHHRTVRTNIDFAHTGANKVSLI